MDSTIHCLLYLPSKEVVDQAFDVLCGSKSFTLFSSQLPTDLKLVDIAAVSNSRWKDLETWVDWWKRPHVLKMLTKAYSALTKEDWDDLPGTTNPVELINCQSIPQNLRSISLKPLVKHIYLEDRRHATLQVATSNIIISYQTKSRKRSHRPPKPPEKRSALSSRYVPTGKKSIGTRVSVEFYDDSSKVSTAWYKGTVIAYNKEGT